MNNSVLNPDNVFMNIALNEAQQAMDHGEVPIGAIVVFKGEVIARAHNLREGLQDPTAHAEILAIREAARKLNRWRLTGAILYVTLEPCAMCAGAAVLSRIDRIVFGCDDPKAGACGSIFDIVRDQRMNHRVERVSGILEKDCRSILKAFFADRRRENGGMEK